MRATCAALLFSPRGASRLARCHSRSRPGVSRTGHLLSSLSLRPPVRFHIALYFCSLFRPFFLRFLSCGRPWVWPLLPSRLLSARWVRDFAPAYLLRAIVLRVECCSAGTFAPPSAGAFWRASLVFRHSYSSPVFFPAASLHPCLSRISSSSWYSPS